MDTDGNEWDRKYEDLEICCDALKVEPARLRAQNGPDCDEAADSHQKRTQKTASGFREEMVVHPRGGAMRLMISLLHVPTAAGCFTTCFDSPAGCEVGAGARCRLG